MPARFRRSANPSSPSPTKNRSASKPVVWAGHDQGQGAVALAGGPSADLRDRIVLRAVVDDDDSQIAVGLSLQRLETSERVGRAVPVQDDGVNHYARRVAIASRS